MGCIQVKNILIKKIITAKHYKKGIDGELVSNINSFRSLFMIEKCLLNHYWTLQLYTQDNGHATDVHRLPKLVFILTTN